MVPQPDGTAMRVDFWYIDNLTRMFMPIAPTLYPILSFPAWSNIPGIWSTRSDSPAKCARSKPTAC